MATKMMELGGGFSLPIDAITEKLAALGQSGAGKTTVGVGLSEHLLDFKQQIVVLDPKGDWWGIRSSKDGKGAGYPVTVFGGLHADLPIYPESGAKVAALIVDKGISAVLDVSDFESDGQRHKFTTEFALAFYKAKQRNKGPVLFVLEEADESVPQQMVEPTEARMVGAIKRIAKLGRFCGIGVLILSQRAADVNKKVLSQASIIIAMRTWHATDLKAIGAALKDQVPKAIYDEVMAALPSLETGEGFVIAPKLGIKKRVKFHDRKTFDAGETPKVGAVRREPKVLAPVEIEALKAEMAAEVEKAKEADPKAWQARVRELESEVKRLRAVPVVAKEKVVTEVKEVPAFSKGEMSAIERLVKAMEAVGSKAEPVLSMLQAKASAVNGHAAKRPVAILKEVAREGPWKDRPRDVMQAIVRPRMVEAKARKGQAAGDADVDVSLGKCERAILTVLAQHQDGCVIGKLALLSGYHVSGGFRNALANLRGPGFITGQNTQMMQVTSEGLGALGDYDPLPQGEGLQRYWLQHPEFGKCERSVLQVLIEAYPEGVGIEELAQKSGYEVSGGFRNSLSKLRTAGVLEGRNVEAMTASQVLFE